MAYYPKSQIKTNLFTNGNEYIIKSTLEGYKGYYYETSNGTKYTGTKPGDLPNQILISPSKLFPQTLDIEGQSPLILQSSYERNYNNTPITPRSLPKPNQTQPTSKDYKLGKFVRYFAKKNNENIYLEINKETHTLLKSQDTKIAWDLYTPLLVIWTLTGVEDKVYLTNKNIVSLAEQQNKWYGFTQWFRDNFLKYYLAS